MLMMYFQHLQFTGNATKSLFKATWLLQIFFKQLMSTDVWSIVHRVFKSIEYTKYTEKQCCCQALPPPHLSQSPPKSTIPHPEWDWKGHSFLYNMQLSHLIMCIVPINMFKIIVLNPALSNFILMGIRYHISIVSLAFSMVAHPPCWHFRVENTSQSNRI